MSPGLVWAIYFNLPVESKEGPVDNNSEGIDFLVNKDDWGKTRFEETPVPEISSGQVLFSVDRFALTANNISYAFAGDLLGYWRFFPAPEGWGRIPAMGFGQVIRSMHPDVAEGIRCFGFYPMSRHLVIEPGQTGANIMDASAHRDGISPFYNQYACSDQDALYQADHEDVLMLLRGLFMTSFLAEDFLGDNDYFGAESVLISSASSKTSIALAHQVSGAKRAQSVGLTSERNREFVGGLGCYDKVLTYGEVTTLDGQSPAVYVDMAGSGPVLRAIHGHFEDRLRHSCSIGATHWDSDNDREGLAGPEPVFFFAPEQGQKRIAELGSEGFQESLASAWSGFRVFTEGWMEIRRGNGREDLEKNYMAALRGSADPSQGQVISLWGASGE